MSRFPFPLPNGWFAVAASHDVAIGEVRPIHYLGRDLVVFRTESGGAGVLDAHCAHLGAHLGIGPGSPGDSQPGPGTVVGECVRCPFHGWQYDRTGACVEIPYSDARIPTKAQVRGWEVREQNGLISVWHHRGGQPPAWEVPELPEFADDQWVGPIVTERTIATCLQEMAENDHDFVHFKYVHGTDEIRPAMTAYHENGRIKTTTEILEAGGDFGKGITTIEAQTGFSRETHQLGFVVLRIPGLISFVAASTPVDEDHVHQRWVFAYPKAIGDELGQSIIDAFSHSGIYEDIPIWEHKAYLEHPVLVKGDGPIGDFRRWAKQFYSDEPTDGANRASPARERQRGAASVSGRG